MQNQRSPMVSRAAAVEAAERLQLLAGLLGDGVLKRILSEANRTIDRQMHIWNAMGAPIEVDDLQEIGGYAHKQRRKYN